MPEIKNSSENTIPFIFLKWLVIVLSIAMVSGFLFLVTILSVKIYNFNTTTQSQAIYSNQDVLISEGEIETIDVEKSLLTIVVNVGDDQFEVSIIDIKDGILINQYTIKQKKSLYNNYYYSTNLKNLLLSNNHVQSLLD